MRKPWMRTMRVYKFNADGTMLIEVATAQRHANTRDALKGAVGKYADALGIDYAEARKRIRAHEQMLGR